jgi:hypothetical protein
VLSSCEQNNETSASIKGDYRLSSSEERLSSIILISFVVTLNWSDEDQNPCTTMRP